MSGTDGVEAKVAGLPVAAYMRMSTDMQVYSILNQTLAISAYADAHGMRIVRSCRDDGKSGLTIENRPGLLALNGPGCRAEVRSLCMHDQPSFG